MSKQKDYYKVGSPPRSRHQLIQQVLGVPRDADERQIKKAL